jgi:hypothetical protein
MPVFPDIPIEVRWILSLVSLIPFSLAILILQDCIEYKAHRQDPKRWVNIYLCISAGFAFLLPLLNIFGWWLYFGVVMASFFVGMAMATYLILHLLIRTWGN